MSRKKDPEQELASALSKKYGVPAVNLEEFEIARDALDLVPGDVANRHRLLPLNLDGSTLIVAIADPSKHHAIDALKDRTGLKVEVCVATPGAIKRAIDRYYFPN